jgi:hypothetical protein
MATRISAVLLLTLLVADAARAQPVAEDFAQLPLNHPVVYVVAEPGAQIKGRLLAFDPESLAISIDGRRIVFQRTAVRRIYRQGDSLRNGMAIGVIAGLIGSTVLAASASMSGCDTFNDGASIGCEALGTFIVWTVVAPVCVGVGILAGAGIDALVRGRTLIYERPRGRSLSLAPMIGPKQLGLGMVVRW